MCYKGCDPHQDESVCYSQLVHGRSCTHTCPLQQCPCHGAGMRGIHALFVVVWPGDVSGKASFAVDICALIFSKPAGISPSNMGLWREGPATSSEREKDEPWRQASDPSEDDLSEDDLRCKGERAGQISSALRIKSPGVRLHTGSPMQPTCCLSQGQCSLQLARA